jgi:hypothetical protein
MPLKVFKVITKKLHRPTNGWYKYSVQLRNILIKIAFFSSAIFYIYSRKPVKMNSWIFYLKQLSLTKYKYLI